MDHRERVIARQMSKPGLRGRINAFCCHCIFDPERGTGTWRQQVEICTSYKCPLYDVRPRSDSGKADLTDELADFSEKHPNGSLSGNNGYY